MTADPLALLLLNIIWDAAHPASPHTAETLARAAREHIAAEVRTYAEELLEIGGWKAVDVGEEIAARIARGDTP